VAAIILISVGSINFLYPNDANALGGKFAEFFNYIVGKTTQNKTETFKQGVKEDTSFRKHAVVMSLNETVQNKIPLLDLGPISVITLSS